MPPRLAGPTTRAVTRNLVLTAPHLITDIHVGFLEAGSDIIETDTFGATRIVLAEYGLEDTATEINRAAAEIARQAADRYSTPAKPRFVAGSMGPTTKDDFGDRRGNVCRDAGPRMAEQAEGLMRGRVDLLILETAQDALNLKAGLLGIDDAFSRLGLRLPVIVCGTVETMGTTLAGQGVEALYVSLAHREPAGHRSQLRDRSGLHDRPSAQPVRAVPLSGHVHAERGACRMKTGTTTNPPSC